MNNILEIILWVLTMCLGAGAGIGFGFMISEYINYQFKKDEEYLEEKQKEFEKELNKFQENKVV